MGEETTGVNHWDRNMNLREQFLASDPWDNCMHRYCRYWRGCFVSCLRCPGLGQWPTWGAAQQGHGWRTPETRQRADRKSWRTERR